MRQDSAEDARRYRKAAEQGDTEAQLSLGYLYFLGTGVEQNFVEAHMWFHLAVSTSSGESQKRATEARDTVAEMMTRSQIDEAERRAREWKVASAE